MLFFTKKQTKKKKRHNHLGYYFNKFLQAFITFLAIGIVILFAVWWFNPFHIPHNFSGAAKILDVILFLSVSYVIWHSFIMDILTWSIALHIKSFRKQKPIPGLKVAFITTIVPQKEPTDLLHACLPAMTKAKYPHDTWVLDEGNSPEVKRICELYGVKHFSRAQNEAYNTPEGKFTKTKGGNHNAWYDAHGNTYDFVAQIDTDFVPKSDFLTKTLGYFRNPKVAFVGTPQIYGNASNSFIARGASEQQYTFYGAVMRGLSSMGMTLLIGANHVVRVKAFREAGHYTAHITEDLVTGMKLHALGLTSVYVPEILAIGQGPSTWSSYFTQQLRWAYGCIDILFHHSPKHFMKMKPSQAIYYFLLQQHYFSGFAMALSILLLSVYFVFGIRAANVDFFQFFMFYISVLIVGWLMSMWLQRFDIGKKSDGELLLFGKLISIAAWPIWLLGLISVITGKHLKYKVTPKDEQGEEKQTSPMVFAPHLFLGFVAGSGLVSSVFTHEQSTVMLFWAFFSAFLMLSVPFTQKAVAGVSYIFSTSRSFLRSVIYPKINTNILAYNQEVRNSKVTLLRDCLFLTLVVIFSLVLYINRLGFYSDDWSFLGNFTLSHNQTFLGLYKTATTPNTFMRPIQNLYDSALFYAFGTHPLGYQIVNSIVFCTIILLLYLVLRKLRLPPALTVTIPLVFALLPNYSTDRFWYAAFQVNLSLMFFLLSLYTGLKACMQQRGKIFLWKVVSISSFVMSSLSYEIVLPLLFLNVFLFINPVDKLFPSKKQNFSRNTLFIACNLIALFYIIIFKLKTTIRLGKLNYPNDVLKLVASISHTNFWTWGLHLPFDLSKISSYTNYAIIASTLILYVIIFLYLFFVVFKKSADLPSKTFLFILSTVGLFIFFLGYTIFFTNNQVGFSPTGIDNRVAIVATIGIAFFVVGFIGWLCRIFLRGHYAGWAFCMIIAIACAGGFFVINSIASFWALAYQQSDHILQDIHTTLPSLPSHAQIILDGVCPYDGPAIVFESQWDLKGALQMLYHDSTVQADIVTPRLKVEKNGIQTQIYTFKTVYSYKNLVIFNDKDKKVYPISNQEEANAYFQLHNPTLDNGCPIGSAGNGVSVL